MVRKENVDRILEKMYKNCIESMERGKRYAIQKENEQEKKQKTV